MIQQIKFLKIKRSSNKVLKGPYQPVNIHFPRSTFGKNHGISYILGWNIALKQMLLIVSLIGCSVVLLG